MKVFVVEEWDAEGITVGRVCFGSKELAEAAITELVLQALEKYPNLRKARFYRFGVVELEVHDEPVKLVLH